MALPRTSGVASASAERLTALRRGSRPLAGAPQEGLGVRAGAIGARLEDRYEVADLRGWQEHPIGDHVERRQSGPTTDTGSGQPAECPSDCRSPLGSSLRDHLAEAACRQMVMQAAVGDQIGVAARDLMSVIRHIDSGLPTR